MVSGSGSYHRAFVRTQTARVRSGAPVPRARATKENGPQVRAVSCCDWMLRQLQLGNLNEPMRVLQLNAPFDGMYSVVNQNVQSSPGSSVIAL